MQYTRRKWDAYKILYAEHQGKGPFTRENNIKGPYRNKIRWQYMDWDEMGFVNMVIS